MKNKKISTQETGEIESYLKGLTESELQYISGLDYGQNADKHYKMLNLVISRGGIINKESEYWYPYEVIELGAYSLQDGHERECAACIMMVILNRISENEPDETIDEYIADRIETIAALPEFQRLLIEKLIWR